MKFIKENKIFVLALAVIVLIGVLLALPGQSFHTVPFVDGFKEHFNGYQFMFGKCQTTAGVAFGKVVPAGVALVVLAVLSIGGLLFSNKSSFIAMVTGLAMLVCSILLFTFTKSGYKAYGMYLDKNFGGIGWAVWLSASLMLVAAGLVIYKSVLMLKDELKKPAKANKGPTYNYLKK